MRAGTRADWLGDFLEQLLLAVHQGVDIVGSQFKAVPVSDGVGGASFDAIAAEDAARIVYVVHLGVAFSGGNAFGIGILRGLNIDAIRGTGRSAQKAANTLFQPILVALQNMNAAISRLEVDRIVRIVFRHRLAEHILERNRKALHQRHGRFPGFP